MAEYVVVYENEEEINVTELDEDENLSIATICAQFGPYSNTLYTYNTETCRKRGKDI